MAWTQSGRILQATAAESLSDVFPNGARIRKILVQQNGVGHSDTAKVNLQEGAIVFADTRILIAAGTQLLVDHNRGQWYFDFKTTHTGSPTAYTLTLWIA